MLKMHRSQTTEKEIWIIQKNIKQTKVTAFYLKNKTKSIIDILPFKVCILKPSTGHLKRMISDGL